MEENEIAQTQIWFCDACRQDPPIAQRFERLEGALTLSEGLGQVSASPLFLASSSRQNAFAEIGGTSIFSQALLWALRGAAAAGPDDHCDKWHVGTTQLIRTLPLTVKNILADYGEDQSVDVTGRVLEMVAQRFTDPPPVDILVNLRPEDAQPPPMAELLFNAKRPPLNVPMNGRSGTGDRRVSTCSASWLNPRSCSTRRGFSTSLLRHASMSSR
jgi:hypothetical protein